jgi:hypothetical protein
MSYHGIGVDEEVVEEAIVEEPAPAAAVTNGQRSVWPQVIAVGAVGFIGLGLLYGMARASGPGASRYSWGGL